MWSQLYCFRLKLNISIFVFNWSKTGLQVATCREE